MDSRTSTPSENKSHSIDSFSTKQMGNEMSSSNIQPSPTLLQKAIAEFVGTFFLVFAGCGAILVDKTHGEGIIGHVAIATTFGIAVLIMVYAVGHISGAHVNSAVTLGFASVGRFPWVEVPAYIGAQVIASTLASLILWGILDDGYIIKLAVNKPSGTNAQSFVIELIITFILMFVISGVASDSRAAGDLAGIAIGFTIALNGVYGGPVSGASMNPARSIGPALVSMHYESLYVYIFGPIIGAILGAWTYNVLRIRGPSEKEEEEVEEGQVECMKFWHNTRNSKPITI